MKKCSHCGRSYSDMMTTCSFCGAALDSGAPTVPRQTNVPPVAPRTAVPQAAAPQTSSPQTGSSEKVGSGILGALLFALGGAVIQVISINMGILSGLTGIAAYLLAVYGYKKFSGCGNPAPKKAMWIAILVTAIMIIFGTTIGYAYVAAKTWGVRLSEAAHIMQESYEMMDALGEDIFMTLGLSLVPFVISLFSGRKKNS